MDEYEASDHNAALVKVVSVKKKNIQLNRIMIMTLQNIKHKQGLCVILPLLRQPTIQLAAELLNLL